MSGDRCAAVAGSYSRSSLRETAGWEWLSRESKRRNIAAQILAGARLNGLA